MLVIQLPEWPLRCLLFLLTEDVQHEYAAHGFVEVWLGDYSQIEAYGDIKLFCLFPADMWGYYERPNPNRKPYG